MVKITVEGISVSNLFQDELNLQSVDSADNKSVRHYRITGSSYLHMIDQEKLQFKVLVW